jgi:hypothetical protein
MCRIADNRMVEITNLDIDIAFCIGDRTKITCVAVAANPKRRTFRHRVCYLRFDCHFWAGNLWGNCPPPEQKKIVRDERTTKRDSIDGGLLDPC